MQQQDPASAGGPGRRAGSRRLRVLLLDVPLAVLVGVGTWFSLLLEQLPADLRRPGSPWSGGPGGPERAAVWQTLDPPWALGVVLLLVVAAVALRRVWPLPSFLAVLTGTAMLLGAGAPFGPLCLGAALSVLALAGSAPVREWVLWAGLLLPVLALGWWPFDADELSVQNLSATTVAALVLTAAALAGVLSRARRLATERARSEELRRSADAERLRIAREVHDVVGHSLSVITMQAGVALHVVNRRPEQAEESLRAIRQTGLAAMAELRSTLEVFREGSPGVHPPPGLGRLDALVQELRAAGRVVEVHTTGELQGLTPSVDHAAYRIVQESLTNVGRHAPTAGAVVSVVRERGAGGSTEQLRVEVRDDGPVRSPGSIRPGHGVAGMRERARALGGSCTVTALAEGGVLVAARLPLPRSS